MNDQKEWQDWKKKFSFLFEDLIARAKEEQDNLWRKKIEKHKSQITACGREYPKEEVIRRGGALDILNDLLKE